MGLAMGKVSLMLGRVLGRGDQHSSTVLAGEVREGSLRAALVSPGFWQLGQKLQVISVSGERFLSN